MSSDVTAVENRVITTWAFIIRSLIQDFRQANADYGEVGDLLKSDPEKRKRFSAYMGDAEWWMDYEKNELLYIVQSVFRIGLSEHILKTFMKGGVRALWSSMFDGTLRDLEVEPRNPTKAIGATFSMWSTLRAINCFGATMHELVKAVETNDDAMLNAVKLDPTVLNCTPCRLRMSRAILEHDQDFLKDVAGAISRPKLLQSAQYPELEFCLYLMRRARILPWFNEKRAWELFGVRLADLKLYDPAGDQRSLIRHIQRRKSRATEKLKTKSSPE